MRHIISFMTAAAVSLAATAQNNNTDSIISLAKQQFAPDGRQIVYDITSVVSPDGYTIIKGETSELSVKDNLVGMLQNASVNFVDSITVYPTDRWAQVKIPVGCFRTKPGHASEMATQGILGQPLRLLEKKGDWWRAQTPDGYIAYIIDSSIIEKNADEMEAWRNADRVIVTAPYQTRVYRDKSLTGLRNVVTDVENGNILLGNKKAGSTAIEVTLPDGRSGYIAATDVENLDTWSQQPFDAEKILDIAYSMEGTPYLWGGTSTKTLDCSGLAKVSYFSNGIILMRDASQQATTGEKISPENWRSCEAGDLLFFGNPQTGKVTHVAIYDNSGNYVHSSGRVKRNSVDPESEFYLSTPFLSASRIKNSIGQRGITRVADHPWYFNK